MAAPDLLSSSKTAVHFGARGLSAARAVLSARLAEGQCQRIHEHGFAGTGPHRFRALNPPREGSSSIASRNRQVFGYAGRVSTAAITPSGCLGRWVIPAPVEFWS